MENSYSELTEDLLKLLQHLPHLKDSKWIQRSLEAIVRIAEEEIDRLDWKILTYAIEDLEKGFQVFYPYRHIRKLTIFGSARIKPDSSEYRLAVEFARHIINDAKLIDFKYFFTRKLFFLRESDAVALFPGGFGTQDEAFETLTLCQTGKYGPAPLVLIDEPDGDYWQTWQEQISENLQKRGLISAEDRNFYTITNDLDYACQTIRHFYRVYHSSRFVGESFVIRLNHELSGEQIEQINQNFGDILVKGKIAPSQILERENRDSSHHLPRLVFYFNGKSYGRLYQLIDHINDLSPVVTLEEHPERK